MLTGLIVMGVLTALTGAGLSLAARLLPPTHDGGIERINAVLPQLQCARCGYPGCRPYAAALLAGKAPLNACPPGGQATINALARLLDRPVEPLAEAPGTALQVAWIDEVRCTGCNLCLPACPVDAIVGAPRFAHTVIAAECTGCGLCLPPCPVDCIRLEPVAAQVPDHPSRGMVSA